MTTQALKPIFVLNGPNLDRLGVREPHIYGSLSLDAIRAACEEQARAAGYELSFRQTAHEGEMIAWLHEAHDKASAVVLNAGAWTHSSIAILDAIKSTTVPVIECHLSNPAQREPFRHQSYVAMAAKGGVFGFGAMSYTLALQAAVALAKAAIA